MDIVGYTDETQDFVEEGNYHAALNIALSGLNECRRNGYHVCVDKFVGIIKDIALTLEREFGSQEGIEQGKGKE